MKKLIIFIVLLLIPILTFADNGDRIKPGWQDGEIFISAPYYYDMNTGTCYRAIYRSMDTGATLTQEYVYAVGENSIGSEIFSDATPGVLYAYLEWTGHLHRCDNYGLDWEFIHNGGYSASYIGGTEEGLIYKLSDAIYLSTNYGVDYVCVNDTITFSMCTTIGNQEGELYAVSGFWGSSVFKTHHSIDYGASFTVQTILPDSLVGIGLWGNYPKLYKGTEPGEVYLLSWHLLPPDEVCPKLFLSCDSARTFEYKYTLPYYDPFEFWYVFCNSGNTPGSFYFLMYRIYPEMIWSDIEIQIAYSNDYGETFTFYTHYFGLNVGVEDITLSRKCYLYQNYPNPFSTSTTIYFSATDLPCEIRDSACGISQGEHRLSQIKIYNIKGQLVKQFKIENSKFKINEVVWDGKNEIGKEVPNGIYLYKLYDGNKTFDINKMIKIN